jgi:hypothetical protein
MQRHGILHLSLFATFFSIGAAALGAAVLCDDLIGYCRNKHFVTKAELSLERLESLNAEYDALLERLESDPNLFRRIAPAALGTEPEDPNAVYPKARARELAVARKALMQQMGPENSEPALPKWLQRCSEPRHRIALFLAGAGLVLVSLVCFTFKPTHRR